MTDDLRGETRIPDRDLAVVLRRAAQLQELRGEAFHGQGLTLEEVQQVAEEVGIDPALIEQAASQLPLPLPTPEARILGAPLRSVAEQVIPAVLTEDQMGELVAVARREYREFGRVSHPFGGVAWFTKAGVGETTVNLVPGDGETLVQVLSNLDTDEGAAVGVMTPAVGLAVGFALAGAVSVGAPVALALGGTAMVATAEATRRWLKRRAKTYHEQAERLAARLREAGVRMTGARDE